MLSFGVHNQSGAPAQSTIPGVKVLVALLISASP